MCIALIPLFQERTSFEGDPKSKVIPVLETKGADFCFDNVIKTRPKKVFSFLSDNSRLTDLPMIPPTTAVSRNDSISTFLFTMEEL